MTLEAELQRQLAEERDKLRRLEHSRYVLSLENKYLKERLYGPNTHPDAVASQQEMLEFFLQKETATILSDT